MRLKFTIVLLILNAGVFGYIYYLANQQEGDASKQNSRMLLQSDALSIKQLIIEGRATDGEIIRRTLEQENGTWMITSPMRWPANRHAVQSILNELQFMETETSFSVEELEESGRTLEDYGLENPVLSLTVVTDAAKEVVLRIGDPTEMANRLYVLSPDGQRVIVVSNELASSLVLDMDKLRNPQILTIPIFEIQALTVQIDNTQQGGTQQRVRIDREGIGEWWLTAPITAPADGDQVERLLSLLTNSKAADFKQTLTPDMGLDNPRMRVTLWGNGRQQTLLIGNENENGDYYAQLGETASAERPIFTVAPTPFIVLKEAQVDLRERNFISVDPEQVHSLQIQRQGQEEVSLQRLENGSWQILQPGQDGQFEPHAADQSMVEDVLAAFQVMEATRFVTDAPTPENLENYGLQNPQIRVTLGNGQEQTLLIGERNEETMHLYAKMANNPSVYEVRPHILVVLNPLPLDYRDKVLFSLPQAAKIQGIQIEDLQTDKTLLDVSINVDQENWNDALAAMNLSAAKQDAVLSLLPQLRSLRVQSYLQDHFQENYKLYDRVPIQWRFRMTVDIFLPGGAENTSRTEQVLFSERIAGTAIGQSQIGASTSADMIFSLTQNMIDALYPLTFELQKPPEPENLAPENQPEPKPENSEASAEPESKEEQVDEATQP